MDVTICTNNRRNILMDVGNAVLGVPNKMTPTAIGKIVEDAWLKLSQIDCHIRTDYFCVMPNHIHGIIVIENQPPTSDEVERRGRRSLQDIVRGFKSVTTRAYNKMVRPYMKNTLWQSSFYDEIIRSEMMLHDIRTYIADNPQKWEEDELYV